MRTGSKQGKSKTKEAKNKDSSTTKKDTQLFLVLEERDLFQRERAAGDYTVIPYFFSKFLTELPGMFCFSLFFSKNLFFFLLFFSFVLFSFLFSFLLSIKQKKKILQDKEKIET